MVFLRLRSPRIALLESLPRPGKGVTTCSGRDVLRHFDRGWRNFDVAYKPLTDEWAVYDNFGTVPELLERGP